MALILKAERSMIPQALVGSALVAGLSLAALPAIGAGVNSQPGAGNAAAAAIAAKSPLVQSAYRLLLAEMKQVKNPALRAATLDAIGNPKTCIAHRVGMDEAKQLAVLDKLKAAGLLDPADDATFPGGLAAGVFPPVLAAASDCPNLPQPFAAAPGSVFGGHHSEPGGLAIHEAFNLSSAISLAENYRRIYGTAGKNGLPEVSRPAAARRRPTPRPSRSTRTSSCWRRCGTIGPRRSCSNGPKRVPSSPSLISAAMARPTITAPSATARPARTTCWRSPRR
jgi:hypothetical protein